MDDDREGQERKDKLLLGYPIYLPETKEGDLSNKSIIRHHHGYGTEESFKRIR